jgi:hypothetical protein
MYSLNDTSDAKKRLGYVNPNFINQLQLNTQINENNEKYKNMINKRQINTKRQLTTEKIFAINLHISNHVAVPRQIVYHGPI